MGRSAIIALTLDASLTCASAQQLGRPQDGFYSGRWYGQVSGQWSGQIDLRVDGRGGKNQGLPPSAADKANRLYDNPLNAYDCVEVEALKPDARPKYQARVRRACDE
jgi:hypothetical protein